MKLLLLIGALALASFTNAQTTLFSEDFESGGAGFTMNTADLGGQAGLAGDNAWVMNNAYTGGSGTSSCFGFGFSLGNTPAQPAGITNSPSSTYMHILSDDGTSNGILNANYSAADGSLCFFAQSHFTSMTADVSTVGMTSVDFSFWWICGGDVNAFGEVYYSTDSGTSWTLITAPISSYYSVPTWTQQTLNDAAWANQASLRFGFRFVNNVATAGSDPAFSIDDVSIVGASSSTNSITTDPIAGAGSWCEGSIAAMNVDFTSIGTYNLGNIYSAELSDGTGSFAAPTVIGTLASPVSGTQSIVCITSGTEPSGAGYRIRVVASDLSTTGTDNGTDLEIFALPTVTQQPFIDVCSNDSPITLVGGSPAGGTYSGTGVSGGMFDPSIAGAGTENITYQYSGSNFCINVVVETITTHDAPTVTPGTFSDVCSNVASFALSGGAPTGGTYSGPGVTAGMFDPATAGTGTHTLMYSYTDGNNCSGSASTTIVVEDCAGLDDLLSNAVSIYPNPTHSSFIIQGSANIKEVQVIDITGKVVKSFSNGQATYNVSNLSKGVYIVQISGKMSTLTKRLVIR